MKQKQLTVKITLIEEMLGMTSANPDITREFIASKAPDAPSMEDEVAALGVDAVEKKCMTVYPRDTDGKTPILWDYQLKGSFKDACSMLNRVPGSVSSKIKAYKKVIDGLFFVSPRRIRLVLPDGETIGNCQRPLRASTAQGERVALANSETVPAGTTFTYTVTMLDGSYESALREWLGYGTLRGYCQWRNSGKGRFTFEIVDQEGGD